MAERSTLKVSCYALQVNWKGQVRAETFPPPKKVVDDISSIADTRRATYTPNVIMRVSYTSQILAPSPLY